MSEEISRFGDVWAYSNWHEDSDLWKYGVRICPWWTRKRIESVRFRPANGDYWNGGEITVFYRRPGQRLGPFASRTKTVAAGPHFSEVIRSLLAPSQNASQNGN